MNNIEEVSNPRILLEVNGFIFFSESIAFDTRKDINEPYTQYVLATNDFNQGKTLTLNENSDDGELNLNDNNKKFSIKIDHLDKTKIIVFSGAANDPIINYRIVEMQICSESNLLATNPSETLSAEEKQDLITKNQENQNFSCADYSSASITGISEDICPDVPANPITTLIVRSTAILNVTTYSSTLKSKMCYKFEVGNFIHGFI